MELNIVSAPNSPEYHDRAFWTFCVLIHSQLKGRVPIGQRNRYPPMIPVPVLPYCRLTAMVHAPMSPDCWLAAMILEEPPQCLSNFQSGLALLVWQTLVAARRAEGRPSLRIALVAMLGYVAVSIAAGASWWTHYLLHSDYRPRSKAYRAIWRNHRLHHYKSEHYWFTVTTAGIADRVLGTYPDPSEVETSPTVRALHAAGD